MNETRNTEMAAAVVDITDWLRERRDEAAEARKRLIAGAESGKAKVSAGEMTAEELAVLTGPLLIEAYKQATLALRYFTALTEIERGRAMMMAMRNALKARGHYVCEEPEGR